MRPRSPWAKVFRASCRACGLLLILAAFAAPAAARYDPVPEISPSSAVSALTLLAGGSLVLIGRRRR